MIKSNQLRLGNWVEYNDYPSKGFTRLNEHLMTCVFSDENWINHFISPIPLTEEILLKCGAFKLDKLYPSYNLNGIILNMVNNNWIDYVSRAKLNYVHKLQNFYYAHKEEELNINL